MKKNILTALGVLFACVLVIMLLPLFSASAEEAPDTVASGYCGSYEYWYNGRNLTWTLSSDGTLTLKGYGTMGDYSPEEPAPWYEYRDQITEIDMRYSADSIGSYAFSGCSALQAVYLWYDVSSVGEYAFENCTSLTLVKLSDRVSSIKAGTFSGCVNLKRIAVFDQTTVVAENAFSGCTSLAEIFYTGSRDQWGRIEIAEGTNTAFENAAVHYGGEDWGFCGLEYIDNEERVMWCLSPDGALTVFGFGEMGDFLDNLLSDFNTPAIKTLTVEPGVTRIGQYAFYGCTSLQSITLPESVTDVQRWAFWNCSSLTDISVGNNITHIGYKAFYGTPWFNAQPNGLVYIGNCIYTYKGTMPKNTEIVLREGTVAVADFAFDGRSQLAAITFPNGLQAIGERAFTSCTALTSISFPDSLRSIGSSAFSQCINIPSVTIPYGVTRIESHSFHYCIRLTEVSIPSSVTYIGWYAFEACSALPEITIPNGVQTIGLGAFESCTALTEVYLPESVSSVDSSSFTGCVNVTSVTVDENNQTYHSIGNCVIDTAEKILVFGCKTSVIPQNDGITRINSHAFYYCPGLTEITIPASVTHVDTFAFHECPDLMSITVAEGNTVYHSAGNCLINTATGELVRGCNTSVIPQDGSVTSIGYGAFYCHKGLAAAEIPDGVTSIGGYAFDNCKALTELAIPNSVTSIGMCAFQGCSNVRELTLGTGVTSLSIYTFYGCKFTDVYYIGSEEQWAQIRNNTGNDALFEATNIHYNCHFHTRAPAVLENVTEATCTSAGGYDEVVYCTQCDRVFSRTHVTVDALGHTPAAAVRENEAAATCTSAGGYDEVVYCTRCPYEFSRTHTDIPAVGHSWGEWTVVKQATTEETGLMRRVCANDPSHVEEEIIPKLAPQTTTFQQFVERIRDFFGNIVDWLTRLFRV